MKIFTPYYKSAIVLFIINFLLLISLKAQTTYLYGMTLTGGTHGAGTIIRFNPVTNQDSVVWNLGSGTDGQNPYGDLVFDTLKGVFYGMTSAGGTNTLGAIIRFNPVTYKDSVVWDLGSGTDGQGPYGNLVYDSAKGVFYGMTFGGGTHSSGAIIRFNPTTNKDSVVWNLGGAGDGIYPHGNLVYNTTKGVFYGMTAGGGSNSNGTIIRFNANTNKDSVLYNLGNIPDGQYPDGNLVYDGVNGMYYGMANQGGSTTDGAIIRFNATTDKDSVVWNLGIGHDGLAPVGDLIYYAAKGVFYGLTFEGGTHGKGAIIRFNPVTNQDSVVWNFAGGTTDGEYPNGNLVYDAANGLFYGMTSQGGTSNKGTIITFNPANNDVNVVWNFGSGSDGSSPNGSLVFYTFCPALGPPGTITGGASVVCAGSSIEFYGPTIAGATSYTWTLPSGWTGSSTTDSIYTQVGSAAGNVTVKANNSCSSVLVGTYTITAVDPKPTITITGNNNVNSGTPDTLVAHGTSTVYDWSTSSTDDTIIVKPTTKTEYYVTGSNASGCSNTDSITVTVTVTGINSISTTNGMQLYPNPSNGVFTVVIKNYELGITNRLEVYNMLGEKIYSMDNAQVTMDNSKFQINLQGQPRGIYLYRFISESGSALAEGKLIIN